MAKKPSQIYQIKVTLKGTHPPIWRRIQVPGDITLYNLHRILQAVMGWYNEHLHMFTIDGVYFGDPADDEMGDLGTQDETKYKLSQVLWGEGQRIIYEYDFGDSWEHVLQVEKILPPEEGVEYPRCLKGKRACPPEDIGGVWGYAGFLEAMQNPEHEEHENYLEWFGGDFDPEEFDLEGINAGLHRMKLNKRARSQDYADEEEIEDEGLLDEGTLINFFTGWVNSLPSEQQAVAENLPLRKDFVTLLTYIRDHKVKGTASTGNLPLKAVREITAQFVNPPALDGQVGDHLYKLRSEEDVRSLYFIHMIAVASGSITGAPGQRWELTQIGEGFLNAPVPLQVWLLFLTVWLRMNWMAAYPFYLETDVPPEQLPMLALAMLLDLPIEKPVPYRSFMEQYMQEVEIDFPGNDEYLSLRQESFFKWVVLDRLTDFNIVQVEYEHANEYGMDVEREASFQVTSFGRGLLEAFEKMLREAERSA